MKHFLRVLLSFVVILFSCESTSTDVPQFSEEHTALIGTWQENDSVKNTTWVFDRYEVKWNGFSHLYTVSGDSLIISGIVYQIVDQSEKKMKLMTLNEKLCVLTRKE